MTRDQLEAHRQLQKKLNEARQIYHEMEERAYPGAQRLDGMPRSSGNTDKVGELGIELASSWLKVDELEREVMASRPPIDAYIDSLDDPVARLVVGLRILCALSWKEVAVYAGREQNVETVRRRYKLAVSRLP